MNTEPRRFWSEAETAILKSGWAEGLTCEQIAARLPRHSRLAVGAKAHRLNLPVRGQGGVDKYAHGTQPPLRGSFRDYSPAPISLAGPAWSLPAGARPAERRAAA